MDLNAKSTVEGHEAYLASYAREHPTHRVLLVDVRPDAPILLATSHPASPVEAAWVLLSAAQGLLSAILSGPQPAAQSKSSLITPHGSN